MFKIVDLYDSSEIEPLICLKKEEQYSVAIRIKTEDDVNLFVETTCDLFDLLREYNHISLARKEEESLLSFGVELYSDKQTSESASVLAYIYERIGDNEREIATLEQVLSRNYQKHFKESLGLYKNLYDASPDTPKYKWGVCKGYVRKGRLCAFGLAYHYFCHAVELVKNEDCSGMNEHRILQQSYLELACECLEPWARDDHADECKAHFEKAVELAELLYIREASVENMRVLMRTYDRYAKYLSVNGMKAESHEYRKISVELSEKIYELNPSAMSLDDYGYRRYLLAISNKKEIDIESLRMALEIYKSLSNFYPDIKVYLYMVEKIQIAIGNHEDN